MSKKPTKKKHRSVYPPMTWPGTLNVWTLPLKLRTDDDIRSEVDTLDHRRRDVTKLTHGLITLGVTSGYGYELLVNAGREMLVRLNRLRQEMQRRYDGKKARR